MAARISKVRGIPKSRREWKSVSKQPARAKFQVKAWKKGFKRLEQERKEKLMRKLFLKELSEEKKKKVEMERERKRSNKKRKEDNERKSEVVQLIKNPSKIKKLNRKQLRQLAMR
ncbi:coiled-coil domain-containing protein 86-like [Zophobas morio]|uniref:coiled-coil domain-containing protein 86-like n=1 Tax=Zophobas morio TaxID=2755281 RepID=UPI003082F0CB